MEAQLHVIYDDKKQFAVDILAKWLPSVKKRDGSIGRILYAKRTWRAIIPLDAPLLTHSSHLPAYSSEPLFKPESLTYAYLMLLRIEVAAFHPAAPRLVAKTRGTEVAVPVRAGARPRRRLVSVALFLSQPHTEVASRPGGR